MRPISLYYKYYYKLILCYNDIRDMENALKLKFLFFQRTRYLRNEKRLFKLCNNVIVKKKISY